jgi:hypothetical protein
MRRLCVIVLLGLGALATWRIVAMAQDAGQHSAPSGQAGARGTGGDGLGFTDTPMLPELPYHVHDPGRPHPHVVTPAAQQGGAPSDATVLFDGKDLSQWTFSRRAPQTEGPMTDEMRARLQKQQENLPPLGWKVENGYVEVIPRAGNMVTKEKFGDVQLHVEFEMPEDIKGQSQNRGNSGVLLQSRYELQVLDSFRSPTYADGQLGAIYGQWPPLVNAARKPGEWQTYDIAFEGPRFEGEKLVKPAYFTVFLNGVLLHNHKDSMGPMFYRHVTHYVPQPMEDALMLQNHMQPVRFRNIWIRRLKGYDQPEN